MFCIDLSPSLTVVNLDSGKVAFDEIFPTLEQCLRGIVKPFYVPGKDIFLKFNKFICNVYFVTGSQLLFYPEIYVTIIAHTLFFKSQPQQVVVQGWLLINEKENLKIFMKLVKTKLTSLQNELALVCIFLFS